MKLVGVHTDANVSFMRRARHRFVEGAPPASSGLAVRFLVSPLIDLDELRRILRLEVDASLDRQHTIVMLGDRKSALRFEYFALFHRFRLQKVAVVHDEERTVAR